MKGKFRNTQAIIFRMHDSKDADRVVLLLTADGARTPAVAKGIRRAKSRKAHALDLGNLVDVSLTSGVNLPVITEARLVSTPAALRETYSGLMFINLLCEIVDLFAQEQIEERGYFNNLANLLSIATAERLPLLAAGLILRYLALNGDLPPLDSDSATGEDLALNAARYTAADIGYTASASTGEAVESRVLRSQKFALSHDFHQLQRLALSSSEQVKMLELHAGWLYSLYFRELKSLPLFLASLNK